MKIGMYDCYPVETGRFALDGGAMFGVVPKVFWEKTITPDEKNRITMAARALLLVGDGRKVLVDTGNGGKFNDKLKSIYRIDTTQSSLLTSLKALNVAPDDITDVILTHLHFDHAGGATTRTADGVRPQFPNASYHVQQDHWFAALNTTERDRASFFEDDFVPLRDHGLLRFTEGEGEILPGIDVLVLNGHTSALQVPLITDGTTTLLCCADLVPLAAHVQLPWIMAYDLRPLVTLDEKRKILKEAVDEGWILFFEHDPTVVAASIKRGEKGYELDRTLHLSGNG